MVGRGPLGKLVGMLRTMRSESGFGLKGVSLRTGKAIGHTSLQIGIFLIGILGYWPVEVKWVQLVGTPYLTSRCRLWYDRPVLGGEGCGIRTNSLIPPSITGVF